MKKINKYIIIVATLISKNVFANNNCSGLIDDILMNDIVNILGIIRFVGIVLIIVLTSYELFTAVVSADDAATKKVLSDFWKRLAGIIILVFLPNLVNLLLGIYNTKYSSCL